MTASFAILALAVVTALAFDSTNGFHDTANAAGMRPGSTVHVTTAAEADRAGQLLAAWRIGLVTSDHPATAGPPPHSPCSSMNKLDRDDRRQVAESHVWVRDARNHQR